MKYIVMILIALGISACEASPEDQSQDMKNVERTMPSGCKLYYAGDVRVAGHDSARPSRIFFTICDGVTTTSVTRTVDEGKQMIDYNDVIVTF